MKVQNQIDIKKGKYLLIFIRLTLCFCFLLFLQPQKVFAYQYSVNISSYDAFRNQVLGNKYDIDGAYGYQCWDGAALLWQQVGMYLQTGNHVAAGCWNLMSDENAGSQFYKIYNINEVKRGDVVVFGYESSTFNAVYYNEYTGETYPTGHIAYADEDYNQSGRINIIGQNQLNHPEFTLQNVPVTSFLGAFRLKSWSDSVSFDTYSIDKVEEYNIRASVWLDNPNGRTISEIGIQCGSDKDNASERTITTYVSWTRANLAYDAVNYYGNLASNRLYYIRYYIVIDGKKYYSDWMEATTKKATITFDTYSIENLYESDVRLSVWVDNPQEKRLTTIGIECGKTWEQAQTQKHVINENVYWTRPNLSYYLSPFMGFLESNTRYAARYYVVCENTTYYSDWFDFTTPAGGISFDTYGGVQEISDKDAKPSVWLDNPSGKTISEIGFEWGTSKTSTRFSVITNTVSWTRPYLNYKMSPYTGSLKSNTKYYCRYYVIVEEKRYSCDWFLFTTNPSEIVFSSPDFVLPASTTTIEESAFEGNEMTVVYIPDTCTSIGDYAFKDCCSLTQIRIPESCVISDHAFDGCEEVYIFGIAGSDAEEFCDNHEGFSFVEEQ